jgi:hypothetical protein
MKYFIKKITLPQNISPSKHTLKIVDENITTFLSYIL